MIVAGIVLYNPSMNRLEENVSALLPQVDWLFLVDNGSTNINLIKEKYQDNKIEIIENGINRGVAYALNVIATHAKKIHAKWVLTLDQDSIAHSDLLIRYNSIVCNCKDTQLASLTCGIKDRNFDYESPTLEEEYVNFCITSGNYINIDVWEKIGGFDEKLFIDKVDTDYCFRLISRGYHILKIPYMGIVHEVGCKSQRYSLLGKKFVVFNHPASRVYFIIRNQIYFARKHKELLGKQYYRQLRTAWTRVIVYIIFEKNKLSKIISWIKGIRDGYRMEV